MKTVVFTHAAAKDLDALPLDARTAVLDGLCGYAIDGRGDVRQGYLSDLETGRRKGTADTLAALATALEFPEAWLLE